MTTPNDAAVDVWAALCGLTDLARHRLTMKRREFDRAIAAGKQPHEELQIKVERAEYLLEQGNAAIAAIRELVACVEFREQLGALSKRERAALSRFATGGE